MHPIVLIDYFPRLVGHVFTCIILLIILIEDHNTDPLPYFLMVLQSLIWPNVALYFSAKSSDPKWLEYRFLMIDCFVVGCWTAYIGFPLWPTILLITCLNMANLSLNGLKTGLAGLLAIILGATTMVLLFGFYHRTQTNLLTNIFVGTGYIIFPGLLGYMTYYRARVLKITKHKLKEANIELDEIDKLVQHASASLELDKVMKIIIESLSNIFSFDYITFQLLDSNKRELYYQSIYGTEFLSNVITKEIKQIRVGLDSDAPSAKTLNKGEIILIQDISEGNENLSTSESDLRKLFEFASAIFFPLIIKNQPIGVVGFYTEKKIDLDQKTIDKIKKHIGHASLVINNAILYNSLKDERKKIKNMNEQLTTLSKHLSKYISPQIYERIIHAKAVEIGAVRKSMTILFSDIVGFTDLSDVLKSGMLTIMINAYFDEMTKIILKHGGTVDKYIGDTIMVFFGDPNTAGPRVDAISCVKMALEMRDKLVALKERWKSLAITQDLKLRIGINSGYCAVGNFGSEYRMEYTVIGNQVNLASRLQHIGKPGEIIISETTYQLIKDLINCEEKELLQIKGFTNPVQTYIVLGLKGIS